MLLVCGGVKGGTGKTTTAANLAIERARRGSRVILVDADPDQESLTDYIANRDTKGHTPSIPVVQAKGTSTSKSLLALARDYTDVVVDCGGFDSVELRQSILVAQAWIIPLNPTQMQVWTMPKLAEILAGANALRGDTPLIGHLLGMRISTHPYTKIDEDLAAIVRDYPDFAALATVVHQRSAFEAAEAAGLSVTELPKPSESARKAKSSISDLCDEIFGAE